MEEHWTTAEAAIIRSMIAHEDDLTNQRMTWLVTLHGFLFAALGFAWKDGKILIPILSTLGITTSLSILYHLYLAHDAIMKLVESWDNRTRGTYKGPDVIGRRTTEPRIPAQTTKPGTTRPRKTILWLARLAFPWYSVPAMLSFAWVLVTLFYLLSPAA
jgi:hypothetical protein